jgi:hypothetical protein
VFEVDETALEEIDLVGHIVGLSLGFFVMIALRN